MTDNKRRGTSKFGRMNSVKNKKVTQSEAGEPNDGLVEDLQSKGSESLMLRIQKRKESSRRMTKP